MYMDKKDIKAAAALVAAVMTVALVGCTAAESSSDSSSSRAAGVVTTLGADIDPEDLEVGYSESDSTQVSFSEGSAEVKGSGASAEGSVVTIFQAGTYVLTGSGTGRIVVDAGKDDQIKLVMDGLELSCEDNSPLTVTKADKVFLILKENTENSLSDGESYTLDEGETTDGAVFCKCDLTITGDGSLTVKGSYKHGIVSKDDLVITGGKLTVTSASSGLVGKDSVKISAGNFDISSGKDGIKSSNDEDETKGNIKITGGTFKIVSNGDGISSETDLVIEDGTFDITTGGGSDNSSMKSDGTPNGDWKKDMGNGGGGKREFGGDMQLPEGFDPSQIPDDLDGQFPGGFDGQFPGGNEGFGGMQPPDGFGGDQNAATVSLDTPVTPAAALDTEESSGSSKGLKAGGSLVVSGGDITINSADDSFHCGGSARIDGGSLNMSSGDDGIHADSDLVINNGTVTISKSYEGIEGMTVTINGGDIDVTARDDGINCCGGNDTGNTGRMGMDQFAAQEGVFLSITGGNVKVDAAGDGLDSNGDLTISGGMITVSGPENGGNGSVDHNGTAIITGGTIIASGAVGMEENFEEGSTQCVVLHDFSSSFPADTEFTVTDSSGNVILSFTNPKTWQGVIFSSPDLKQGETYTVSAGSESETLTLESIVTSNGSGFGGGFGGGGDFGGGDFGGGGRQRR